MINHTIKNVLNTQNTVQILNYANFNLSLRLTPFSLPRIFKIPAFFPNCTYERCHKNRLLEYNKREPNTLQ